MVIGKRRSGLEDDADGPSKVMHEDDPVFVKYYPTKLTRQNVKRLAILGAIIAFALFAYTGLLLVHDQNKFSQEQQERTREIRHLACALAAPFPDRAGGGLVGNIRKTYNCPPFNPDAYPRVKVDPPPHTPTAKP